MTDCPCNSGKTLNKCCLPIINNSTATTALALMRSRYTAYKTVQAEYLYKTTHPKTKKESSIAEIEQWAKENTWTKLEIVSAEKGSRNDESGTVEFKAYFKDKNGNHQIHHEKSTFIKEDGLWFYLEGIANPQKMILNSKVSRNDPCPCGSGKKFKKCCA